jgi:hypothetical protein
MTALLNRVFEYQRLPYILAALIFISSLGLLTVFKTAATQLVQLDGAKTIAEELAKSSDGLTATARYYVTTRQDHWLVEFNRILQIRNGEISNQQGLRQSFKAKVELAGFEPKELDLILKSEQLSNELAKLETQAFKYIDQYKQEREPEKYAERQSILAAQAEVAVFGTEYQRQKAQIMDTASEFYQLVHLRLNTAYHRSMQIAWILITIINVALLMLIVFIQHQHQLATTPKSRIRMRR